MEPLHATCSLGQLSPAFLEKVPFGTLLWVTNLPSPFFTVDAPDCEFIPSPSGIILRQGKHYFLNGKPQGDTRPLIDRIRLFPVNTSLDGEKIDFNGVSVPRHEVTRYFPHPYGAVIRFHDDGIVRLRLLVLRRIQ